MRLRFIGRDGSLGLRHGRIYRLSVRPWRDGVYITFPFACPYDTDELFWQNWAVPEARTCKGLNSNVCVAEGCYSESCIKEERHDPAQQ